MFGAVGAEPDRVLTCVVGKLEHLRQAELFSLVQVDRSRQGEQQHQCRAGPAQPAGDVHVSASPGDVADRIGGAGRIDGTRPNRVTARWTSWLARVHLTVASVAAISAGGGSPRGIGRALCRRLARGGWSVAVLDVNGEAASAVAEQVTVDYGVPAVGVGTDIADESAVAYAIALVEQTLPPVVGLANVAGGSSPTPFLQVATDEWDRVFDVNIRGQFFVIRQVLPGLVSRGLGRIVNVSSASAQRGGGTYGRSPTPRRRRGAGPHPGPSPARSAGTA